MPATALKHLRSTTTATLVLLTLATASAVAHGTAPQIPISTTTSRSIQRQPPPGTCHAHGTALYSTPDPACTPGALNPTVTQGTIQNTICRAGWTSSIRPPENITEPEKYASLRAYGDPATPSRFEYDHLIPLELGGAPNDPRNLWPELDYPTPDGYDRNPKDQLEHTLNRLVCDHQLTLTQAQQQIAANWVTALQQYG